MSAGINIFYIGTDDSLYHNYQDPSGPNGWAGEKALGGSAKNLIVARNPDGRLELFYIGTDNNIYHNYQDPNNPINADGQPGGIYNRSWTIAPLGTDSRRITVTVQWSRQGKPGSVVVSSNTKGGGV